MWCVTLEQGQESETTPSQEVFSHHITSLTLTLTLTLTRETNELGRNVKKKGSIMESRAPWNDSTP